jgi:hypothetical protein
MAALRIAPSVLAVLLVAACKPASHEPPPAAKAPPRAGCLAAGDGYFRAQLHGAREARIEWRNAAMTCEGGLRPDASGIRVSILGEARPGEPLRFVFGISAARENEAGRALSTNLTVILEKEHRIFATLGDDKCTIDELRQQSLPGDAHGYRIEARGFCIAPATVVGGSERLLVSTFDFATRIHVESEPPAAPTKTSTL